MASSSSTPPPFHLDEISGVSAAWDEEEETLTLTRGGSQSVAVNLPGCDQGSSSGDTVVRGACFFTEGSHCHTDALREACAEATASMRTATIRELHRAAAECLRRAQEVCVFVRPPNEPSA